VGGPAEEGVAVTTLGPAVGVLVTTFVTDRGVAVTVGVLVAAAEKICGCVAKKAAAMMMRINKASAIGRSQRGVPLGLVLTVRTVLIGHRLCTICAVRYCESVRVVRPALAGLGFLVVLLVGCGSSSPPVLVLSCIKHRLPAGNVRVKVTVRNTTAVARAGVLYGPALPYVRRVYPMLQTHALTVKHGGRQTTSIGLLLPHIKANGAAHVLLRFHPPAHPAALSIAPPHFVKGDAAAQSGSCHIGR
jgi:hypothetical protein